MRPAGIDFVGLSDTAHAELADLVRRSDEHDRVVKATAAKTNAPEYAAYQRKWDAYRTDLASLKDRADSTLSWVWEDEITTTAQRYNNLLTEWGLVPMRIGVGRRDEQIRVLEELVEERGGGIGPVPTLPQSQAGRAPVPIPGVPGISLPGAAGGLPGIPDISLEGAMNTGIKLAKLGIVGVVLYKIYEYAPSVISRIKKF